MEMLLVAAVNYSRRLVRGLERSESLPDHHVARFHENS
jgi:hypothetical protein